MSKKDFLDCRLLLSVICSFQANFKHILTAFVEPVYNKKRITPFYGITLYTRETKIIDGEGENNVQCRFQTEELSFI